MEYTRELVESTVKKSKSLADACRILGLSSHADKTIKKKIKEFNIDTSHFTRRGFREIYTKELLDPIVKESVSISAVLVKLNLKITGSNHIHISSKIKSFSLDTSHFRGKGWNLGNKNAFKSKHPEEILVHRIGDNNRQKARILKKALLRIGRAYICEVCGSLPIHNNLELKLQIDHKDNNIINDTQENLQFICPNCHTQKTLNTHKGKACHE